MPWRNITVDFLVMHYEDAAICAYKSEKYPFTRTNAPVAVAKSSEKLEKYDLPSCMPILTEEPAPVAVTTIQKMSKALCFVIWKTYRWEAKAPAAITPQ